MLMKKKKFLPKATVDVKYEYPPDFSGDSSFLPHSKQHMRWNGMSGLSLFEWVWVCGCEWNQSEKWWTLFIKGDQEKPLWWMVFQQRPEGGEGMSELSICGGNSTWDRSLLGSCSTARWPAWRRGWIRVQEALQRLGHVGPFRFWLVFGVLFCVRRETIARLWT